MFKFILLLVIVKGIIISGLLIGIVKSSLIDAIIVACVSGFINGMMYFLVARYANKPVVKKVDEVKQHIEEVGKNNG